VDIVSDPILRAAADAAELDSILAQGSLHTVFQPIVALEDERVIGHEALTRGPAGSRLERPDRLFAAAADCGRTLELDWACRAAALTAALEARLATTLFLNCEPVAFDAPTPPQHAALWGRAAAELDIVLEITERALTRRPAELVRAVDERRAAGRGIALDDVGADIRSLALLPLVDPDVIKLDLRLVQDRPSTDQAAIVAAVAAERERTGATILAEGIETVEHLAVAHTVGATLGQGWLWGRPGPPPVGGERGRAPRARRTPRPAGSSPFDVVSAERPPATATKRLLLPMSLHLEHQAMRIGEGAVVLSAFQTADRFTPATLRRYERLAASASLVAAFGIGLPVEPCPGVRGANIEPGDPLTDEWSVVVVGPHFAAALVARDLGDAGPDDDRRFASVTTYDRGLVLAAAHTLLRRIAPSG
jgi:EAL domain-containing protein (putative c-di-GMP-specific phosphodiesterase class I)